MEKTCKKPFCKLEIIFVLLSLIGSVLMIFLGVQDLFNAYMLYGDTAYINFFKGICLLVIALSLLVVGILYLISFVSAKSFNKRLFLIPYIILGASLVVVNIATMVIIGSDEIAIYWIMTFVGFAIFLLSTFSFFIKTKSISILFMILTIILVIVFCLYGTVTAISQISILTMLLHLIYIAVNILVLIKCIKKIEKSLVLSQNQI